MMDKEFITKFKRGGGKTIKLFHSHFRFEVACPINIKLAQLEETVNPRFKLLSDVMRGFVCEGKFCVWPIKAC